MLINKIIICREAVNQSLKDSNEELEETKYRVERTTSKLRIQKKDAQHFKMIKGIVRWDKSAI